MPLVRGRYAPISEEWLLDGQLEQVAHPGSPVRSTLDRRDITADVAAALTTQVILAVAIPLQAGDVITNLTFKSGATAAGTPTNWWFALYDNSATPNLLQQTADQTTTAWAANTAKQLALASVVAITVSGIYYAAIMVKATTVPSLPCDVLPLAGVSSAVLTGQKTLALTSGSALTTTAPATLATPTAVVNVPYCVAN
jgi:hypothetical protein